MGFEQRWVYRANSGTQQRGQKGFLPRRDVRRDTDHRIMAIDRAGYRARIEQVDLHHRGALTNELLPPRWRAGDAVTCRATRSVG
jgi:hypothetical protein